MRNTVFKPRFITSSGSVINERSHESDKFFPVVEPVQRTVGTFKEEIVARLVALPKDKQIVLMYSGGIDSEILAMAMIELGMNVEYHFIRLLSGTKILNHYDYKYAEHFALENRLELQVFDCDWDEFMRSAELKDYVEKTRYANVFTAPMYCHHRKIWEAGKYPIMASNDPNTLMVSDTYCVDAIELWSATRDRYLADMGDARFFDSSELFLAYIKDPIVAEYEASRKGKKALYQKHFPGLRDRVKSIGFDDFSFDTYRNTFRKAMLLTEIDIFVTSHTLRYTANSLINHLEGESDLNYMGPFQTPSEPMLIHSS